jgi:hypothetical protein
MPLDSLPTGTVGSGRSAREPSERDLESRVAELERENEALRAAVERQRREHERVVAHYEELLEQERNETADCGATERETVGGGDVDGFRDRLSRIVDAV